MRKRTHREIDCLFPFYRERNPTITKLSAQQPRGRGAEEMTAFYLVYVASIITLTADLSYLSCVRATPYPTPLPSPKIKLLFFFFFLLLGERDTHMTTGPGCIIDHTITNCMSIRLKNVCFFTYLTKFPTHIFFTFYTNY